MPTARRKAPAKPKTAHQKRVAKLQAGGKAAPKKKSPLAAKKITEKKAVDLMKKQTKARKLKRAVKKHMKNNKPGYRGTSNFAA